MNSQHEMLLTIESLCAHTRHLNSEGAKLAQSFIESRLKEFELGYVLHTTQVPSWKADVVPYIEFLTPSKTKENGIVAPFSPPTPSGGIEGRVMKAGQIRILDSFDWERFAITGPNGKVFGYIISTDTGARTQPLPEEAWSLPHVIVNTSTLQMMQKWIQAGDEVYVRVNNPTKIDGYSQLVSVITDQKYDIHYPLVCSHYDTVFNTVGALDNASGVAVSLKLAHESTNTKHPINFAFFDGEELNKSGSRAYVQDTISINTLNNISFVLELDAVGAGNEICLLCSECLVKPLQCLFNGVESTLPNGYKLTISGRKRIAFSDVWPFMENGVPVIRVLTRGNETRDLMHTPEDTTDKLDIETLMSVLTISRKIIKDLVLPTRQ